MAPVIVSWLAVEILYFPIYFMVFFFLHLSIFSVWHLFCCEVREPRLFMFSDGYLIPFIYSTSGLISNVYYV